MQPGQGMAATATTTMTGAVEPPTLTLCGEGEADKTDPSTWAPHYHACVQYFLTIAQHKATVRSLAAYLNIVLPFQHSSAATSQAPSASSPAGSSSYENTAAISLVPYIRRLVITANDTPGNLMEFFGPKWHDGVASILSEERINYLFAAKSGGWLETKERYDILPDQTVPFLRPLREPQEEEIRVAEARWSDWLAYGDWMIGQRSPW